MNQKIIKDKLIDDVHVMHGTEGPKHDPYRYTEYSISRDNKTYTLHTGLGTWLKVNQKVVSNDEAVCLRVFNERFGMDIFDFIAMKEEEACLCPVCKTDEFIETFAGYPGESITMCTKCNTNLDYPMDRGAII